MAPASTGEIESTHDPDVPVRVRQADRVRDRAQARARQRRNAILACCIVVLGVYMHCAWSYHKTLEPAPNSGDFQNLIADAFLAGQTNLTIPTPPLLLHLKNPYDAVANLPARAQGVHDLSFYKGKLYAYFGPAPAILLFIPYRLLHVGDLSPTLACLIFAVVGFAFSVLLFQLLIRRFFGSIPIWMECGAVLALGLAIPTPFIIYVGRDYEGSIACGYALLFIGLYFLARGLWSGSRPRVISLGIGSLFLAGAVGARATCLAAGVFLIGAAVVLARRYRSKPFQHPLLIVSALVAPYLAIGVLLALYNYVRFGSVTEFGASYQLFGVNTRTYPFNQLWYIPHGFYYFLFSPARYMNSFPYIFLRANTFHAETYLKSYENEPVAGFLTNMPVITVGLVMALAGARRIARRRDSIGLVIGLCAAVPLLMMVATTYAIRGTTMRYELDYAPLLLVAGLVGWLYWSRTARDRPVFFWSGQFVWGCALVASVGFNLAIAATPL